jgi:hypothetical protein
MTLATIAVLSISVPLLVYAGAAVVYLIAESRRD